MEEHYAEQPSVDDLVIGDVLRALGDPVRQRIVAVLSDGEFHPCRAEEFGVPLHKSTLTHHFKVMRQSGLTQRRVVGRDHAVRLRMDDLDQQFPGLLSAVLPALTSEGR